MKKISKKIDRLKKDKFWGVLLKNSFWAFAGDSVASIINLIITIVLIRLIGTESFGILVLAQSYMNIMDVLINIQSWRSVIQYGKKALINNDINRFNSYVKLGCVMDVSTAIACCAIAILIVPILGNIFGWTSELIMCCKILSITIISHFAGTPTAILRLLDKYKLVAVDKFLAAFFKIASIIIVFLLFNKMDLIIAAWIFAISDFIGNIILVIFAGIVFNKKYSIIKMLKSRLHKDKKEFIRYTLWATVSEIVDIPVNHVDVFIVSLLGNTIVSVYKGFKQIVNILNKVTIPLQQSILPQFSELSALGKKKRGFEVVIKIRNLILKVTIPIVIIVGITSPYWLDIIYGSAYKESWYILLLYMVVQTIALSYATIHPFFLSLGNTKKEALIVFIANLTYILLAYVLVNLIGLIGMVIAFAVQVFIVVLWQYIDIEKVIKNEEIQRN